MGDDVYDIYMAKKDSGKPKDDYPNFETKMSVKTAKVKENRFSVVFSERALILSPPIVTVKPE